MTSWLVGHGMKLKNRDEISKFLLIKAHKIPIWIYAVIKSISEANFPSKLMVFQN